MPRSINIGDVWLESRWIRHIREHMELKEGEKKWRDIFDCWPATQSISNYNLSHYVDVAWFRMQGELFSYD